MRQCSGGDSGGQILNLCAWHGMAVDDDEAKQRFHHQWVLIHQSPQPPPPMPLGSPPRSPRK